ncbi:MAG: hypothetical protein H0U70_09230 [Tatlockia sp.]|nr:hypothetical protein [Tatlockia sp.]
MKDFFNSFDLLPVVISTVVIFIMIFSLYVTIKYSSPEQYKKTRLNVFFSTLASVAIIFVGINIMLSSLSFEYNQRFSRHTKTKEAIDKLWLYPNQLIQSATHARPEFIASFFMNNPKLYQLAIAPNKKTPLTLEANIEEQFIADVMIEAWEDCLAIRKYDQTPLKLWLRSFLTWAQSPYLKDYYIENKYGYMDTTQQLGDLLFEYAQTLPKPVNNISLYNLTAEKMIKDSRFISLIKSTV